MGKSVNKVNIKNRKVSYDYEMLEQEISGISLVGSEVKSIRSGNASIGEAHCLIEHGEVFIVGMHVAEYKESIGVNHEPYRKRKLLLTKRQIKKFDNKLKIRGNTIVPLRLFTNDKGILKLEIALVRGKKKFEKRESIKEKDIKRDVEREIKG